VFKKEEKVTEEREKTPSKFPKILYPPPIIHGGFKGFTVVEVDEPE
jgi:hypothetical protein